MRIKPLMIVLIRVECVENGQVMLGLNATKEVDVVDRQFLAEYVTKRVRSQVTHRPAPVRIVQILRLIQKPDRTCHGVTVFVRAMEYATITTFAAGFFLVDDEVGVHPVDNGLTVQVVGSRHGVSPIRKGKHRSHGERYFPCGYKLPGGSVWKD